jgi:hypothetical protein
MAIDNDGNLLFGMDRRNWFYKITPDGTTVLNICRFESPSFLPTVIDIKVDSQNRIYISGYNIDGHRLCDAPSGSNCGTEQICGNITRLNSDFTLDTTFNSGGKGFRGGECRLGDIALDEFNGRVYVGLFASLWDDFNGIKTNMRNSIGVLNMDDGTLINDELNIKSTLGRDTATIFPSLSQFGKRL